MWEVMKTLDEHDRLRLAVVADGRRVVFLLWPGQEQEADAMCCWRNAALQNARRLEQVA